MKKIVTSMLGISLLSVSLFAAGNQEMSGMMNQMNHTSMNKKHMQKCEAFMQEYKQSHTSWTPPKNKLLELYPASEG